MVRFFRKRKEAEEPAEAPVVAPEATAAQPPEETAGGEAVPVGQAVERTRRTFFSRIGGMFRRGLSDDLWDELEETLIAADTGVKTTLRILTDVRERVDQERISDPEAALAILKEDMVGVLDVDTGRGQIWHSNGHHETLRLTEGRGDGQRQGVALGQLDLAGLGPSAVLPLRRPNHDPG